MTRPSIPIASTHDGIASANARGWSITSGTWKSNVPHVSVATSAYPPTIALETVIGAITTANGTGAATSNSRVPSQRWFSRAFDEPTTTSDHISITDAPSDAARS